ncbi:MAG: endopeptidase La [Bacteroidales bacterium]|jgi:ATP-dependent Lon protease|nr:endopeptidase La [Bacteroidales bacterium]
MDDSQRSNFERNMYYDMISSESEIIPLFSEDEELDFNSVDVPESLPILPLKNAVLFPGIVMPITVGREKSIELVRDYNKKSKIIGTATQKNPQIEDPQIEDLYEVASIAQIVRILEMPDGNTTVILQGLGRVTIEEQLQSEPYLMCKTAARTDVKSPLDDEFKAILGTLKDMIFKIIKLSANIPKEITFAIKNITNPLFLINFIAANTDVALEQKLELMHVDVVKDRATLLMKFLAQQIQMLEIKNDILMKTRKDINQQQRDFFLQQQIKQIQSELGDNSMEQEIQDLRDKAQHKKWPDSIRLHFEKEVTKLARMNVQAAEHSVHYNYVQTLIELPWDEHTEDNFDLDHAQKILDEDHYGLEKVKDRIIEHLAVLKLKGDFKSPIICLYGPPGVGKTSLGKSVARALNRKYARISLGGLHDESEIRGHRKTYIGAMPGRIIQNIKKIKTSNPVFVLDEIDKVGKDFRGDPESALLEVLDPEQNNSFYDNYLELDYDLSNVLFIATANNIGNISPALRDRMELIDVSGYIIEEKVEIAKRHLIPNQLKNHGFDEEYAAIFTNELVEHIVTYYTRESGVRTLDKRIASVLRALAKKMVMNEEFDQTMTIPQVETILGPRKISPDIYQGNDIAGVVTGLAWTQAGGDILFIETSLSKGKDLSMTGNLGNVMKESATIALEYIKAHAQDFDIDSNIFENTHVHVHVPEGAIPKDGPSAGVTMVTSMISAFTKRKVKARIAMTGEITLRGKVLPVGGIKEKILAAKRAGITEIFLCTENKKDVDDIAPLYVKGLKFTYISTIQEVVGKALLKTTV